MHMAKGIKTGIQTLALAAAFAGAPQPAQAGPVDEIEAGRITAPTLRNSFQEVDSPSPHRLSIKGILLSAGAVVTGAAASGAIAFFGANRGEKTEPKPAKPGVVSKPPENKPK
jgi:hypothetical protein